MKIDNQVPAYKTKQIGDKKSEYAICIFVINEGEKIRKQLRAMAKYSTEVDIIIADGGSSDGSLDGGILEEAKVTALLTKTGKGKLSAQMRMAFAWCVEQGYKGIITIDGNGKDGIDAIPKFVKLLKEGFDHIQGSRFIPGGLHVNTPLSRYLGLKILHAPLISLAAGFRYTDTTNGFRGYSRDFLLDPRVQPFRDCFSAYELHYYLAIRAARLKFKCIETPVSRVYPKGKVPTKISGFRGNFLVLKTLFKAALGHFNPE
jgi:glycosyltransferase involved in cell wall biosynthesis